MGPSREAVARAALSGLLSSNLDLFGTAVDRCYDPHARVAAGYFMVSDGGMQSGQCNQFSFLYSPTWHGGRNFDYMGWRCDPHWGAAAGWLCTQSA